MDLEQAKLIDTSSAAWARVGMLISFAVAVGILVVSLWMPTTAKAIGQKTFMHRAF